MVNLYGFAFLFCLGVAVLRLEKWNPKTETDIIAFEDAKACLILAILVLVNWGIFYFFKEKTPYTFFVSGVIVLIITFKRKNICAELLSGYFSIFIFDLFL